MGDYYIKCYKSKNERAYAYDVTGDGLNNEILKSLKGTGQVKGVRYAYFDNAWSPHFRIILGSHGNDLWRANVYYDATIISNNGEITVSRKLVPYFDFSQDEEFKPSYQLSFNEMSRKLFYIPSVRGYKKKPTNTSIYIEVSMATYANRNNLVQADFSQLLMNVKIVAGVNYAFIGSYGTDSAGLRLDTIPGDQKQALEED